MLWMCWETEKGDPEGQNLAVLGVAPALLSMRIFNIQEWHVNLPLETRSHT